MALISLGSELYVDSETLAAAQEKADLADANLVVCHSADTDTTLRFRGDPLVYDPRLDKLRERVVNYRDGDSIVVDRPPGESAAHEWVRNWMIQTGLQDHLEDPLPIKHLQPWYLRLYGLVDPVEFWIAAAMLFWILRSRLSF